VVKIKIYMCHTIFGVVFLDIYFDINLVLNLIMGFIVKVTDIREPCDLTFECEYDSRMFHSKR